MAVEQKTITTAADSLLEILREKKEMSLPEAAKAIGVAPKTLEAWATFLEEEGVISVKYKFTTAYLTYKEPTEERSKNPEVTLEKKASLEQVKDDIKKIEELIQKASRENQIGEFGLVKETSNTAVISLRQIFDKLGSKFIGLKPEQKLSIQKKMQGVQDNLVASRKLIDEKDFTSASKVYVNVTEQLQNVLGDLKEYYLLVEKTKNESGDQNSKRLLEVAYKYMQQGKIPEAKRAYEELSRSYEGFSQSFSRTKSGLEKDLMKLHKELSTAMDKHYNNNMQEGEKALHQLLKDASNKIKKGAFEEAEGVYQKIKKVFEGFPPGFYEKKKDLQNKALELYEVLSVNREKQLQIKFTELSKKIKLELETIKAMIKEGNHPEAIKSYNNASEWFAQLPEGFIKEKFTLQSAMLHVYEDLSALYQTKAIKDMQSKSAEIKQLLSKLDYHLQKKETLLADKSYEKIKLLFDELPAGFLQEKTLLQNRIITSYEKLSQHSSDMLNIETNSKVTQMQKLQSEAFGYLKNKRFELAEHLYTEIISLYNSLPAGYMVAKSTVRRGVLKLYKEILINADSRMLKDEHPDTATKYRQILTLLLDAKHKIEHGEFDLMVADFHKLEGVYASLPYGFVEKNARLREQVMLLKNETKLYKQLMLLPLYAKQRDVTSLKSELAEISELKAHIASKASEDKTLIDFANIQYAQFLQLLHQNSDQGVLQNPRPLSHAPPVPVEKNEDDMQDIKTKISALKAGARPKPRIPTSS